MDSVIDDGGLASRAQQANCAGRTGSERIRILKHRTDIARKRWADDIRLLYVSIDYERPLARARRPAAGRRKIAIGSSAGSLTAHARDAGLTTGCVGSRGPNLGAFTFVSGACISIKREWTMGKRETHRAGRKPAHSSGFLQTFAERRYNWGGSVQSENMLALFLVSADQAASRIY